MTTKTRNPDSVHIDQARELARQELASQGWAWVEELAEFVHTDGNRGRLNFIPDFDAPLEGGRSVWVREVHLQPPSRKPSAADILNRVPTVAASSVVLKFW